MYYYVVIVMLVVARHVMRPMHYLARTMNAVDGRFTISVDERRELPCADSSRYTLL